MNAVRRFLCRYFGIHDWRHASRYTKPGYMSHARCQWCEERLWLPEWPDPPQVPEAPVVYQNTNFLNELAVSDSAVRELVYSGNEVTLVHSSWSPAGLVHEHETKFRADHFPPSCLHHKFRLKA